MNGESAVSLIIPTYNRCASLRALLDALRVQTYPLEQLEVIVVADGCTDDTSQMLGQYEAPFALHVVEQSNQGPSSARNHGIARASGKLLLFLDDDMWPIPQLVDAHVRAQRHGFDRVVIGYCPPSLTLQTGFLRQELEVWFEAMFSAMCRCGHRFVYTDLVGGNFSAPAELLLRVGGFAPAWRCHEDYELGVRLLKAEASFSFAAHAIAYHRSSETIDQSMRRKFEEGRADVWLGRHYPELRAALPLTWMARHSSMGRALISLAFARAPACDTLAAHCRRLLGTLERVRLRGVWRRLLYALLSYSYWRGAASELNTIPSLNHFLVVQAAESGGDEVEPVIDLAEGPDAAERRLDLERPPAVQIRYGRQEVGRILPRAGAERLRAAHLRPVLATGLALPLLEALALEYAPGLPAPDGLIALCARIQQGECPHEVDCV